MTKSQASDKKIPCASLNCDKEFGREPDMRRHFAATHANIKYYCPGSNCSYSSKRQHRVTKHYQNHHAEVFELPSYSSGSGEAQQQQAGIAGISPTSMGNQQGDPTVSTIANVPMTYQAPPYSSLAPPITSHNPQTAGTFHHAWTLAGVGNYTTQTPHPNEAYDYSAHDQNGSGAGCGGLEQDEMWSQDSGVGPVDIQGSHWYEYGTSKGH